ncbi:2-oxoacid:acceptor oxidoreductase subunit alpha [Desulforhopalus singaporensis]|uniref:2-oxoglutarate ferredoxin oxidoreductase subunit alpha n=1 Tax=Desulforhopalus singaporensis TaxID=91360 RepID=A0A1H0Q7X3_9BACT|nr:2-oxoacid:acceptor oxidoreductase subunit alpha [Desulforhopalus singaporensis]SDP13463.1 2-oxoglutarate ferredoxin oxidoreductase subunit alpha [Desulforhopalus singaporensis]
MNRIESVNDFVIRFANVNGSGSASANNLFARAVFRAGVPVSPKNIFPSNIQGLPTWYEVRVSGDGFLGRRGGIDMTVAINGQTMQKDYHDLLPGGYYLYDSSKQLPEDFQRDDVIVIGIPLTRLCSEEFSNPKLRQLLKNIIYVGALAFLLDIELALFTDSVTRQFKKKPKLAEPNIRALEIGFNYASEHYQDTCGLTITKTDKLGDDILMDGNSAFALGAIYGGATVAGWYPITPSTSVIEAFDRYSKTFRIEKDTGRSKVAILQAEDELAAIGIAIGAAWNGSRSFTPTSGPGISLMNEFLGLAYFAEIPVVVVDIQRAGPSTGMPTRTQQADLLSCAYASHGDTKNVLLFPCDPRECFELGAAAFDLAERLQTPIIVMSDLDLGMNDHVCGPLSWDDSRKYDRGKVLSYEDLETRHEKWGRYLDVDGDGICFRTYPGTHPTKGAYFTRGTSHTEYSAYTEESSVYKAGMERLLVKWDTAKTLVPSPRTKIRDPKKNIALVFYGTTTHAAYEAMARLEKRGTVTNSMRIRAFPFQDEVINFIDQHQQVFVIEQNRDAQLRTLLIAENSISPTKLQSVLNFDGLPITADFITEKISALLEAGSTAGKKQP